MDHGRMITLTVSNVEEFGFENMAESAADQQLYVSELRGEGTLMLKALNDNTSTVISVFISVTRIITHSLLWLCASTLPVYRWHCTKCKRLV